MDALGTARFSATTKEWELDCTPDLAMRLKRVFPRIVKSHGAKLHVRHTAEIAADLEWVMMRFPLTISEVDRERIGDAAREYRERIERMEAIMRQPPPASGFAMAYPPRDYQTQAAALYLERGNLLLADVVGLGKTVSAIATFCDPRTVPVVVVVKAHLPKQWKDEIAHFLPGFRVHIIKKTAHYILPDAQVYVVSYNMLWAWWGYLAKVCRSVVFDEIQELRIAASKKYRAAQSLTELLPYRLGLSATPIHNYGGEMWNVFNLLCPDALGSRAEFENEWCSYVYGGKAIVNEPEALGAYLRNQKMILRRTRQEVGRELPQVVRYVQEAQFDREIYERGTSSADELARIILSGSFVERGQAAREFDLRLRQATGLAKAPYVAELVRMLIESGEKVLLGGWHRAVYDVWRQRLSDLRPAFFTGAESATQKEAARRAFIDGDTDLLIMSLRSGAGTNGLQDVCSVCVLGEMDWTPAVHEQFIGRINRDGQKESVQVFIPVAPVGSDPVMASVLGLKEAQATGIVDLGKDDDMDLVEVEPNRLRKLAEEFLRSRGKVPPVAAIPTTAEFA